MVGHSLVSHNFLEDSETDQMPMSLSAEDGESHSPLITENWSLKLGDILRPILKGLMTKTS